MRKTILITVVLLVAAHTAHERVWSAEPDGHGGRASVAILYQPDLPTKGRASSPQVLSEIFRAVGFATELLSAEQLADVSMLNAARFQILVLPAGETFPVIARDALEAYLRAGGHLITMGGYAFEDLVRSVDGQWMCERDAVRRKWELATDVGQSLLRDGRFESSDPVPVGEISLDGRWRRTDQRATLSRECPGQGQQCAQVRFAQEDVASIGGFYAHVAVTAGRTYLASGSVRTAELSGPGIAYLSVYPLDENGQWVDFRDFAMVRESAEWQRFEYRFTPPPGVTRVRVQCGLYRKCGTAWFDDVQLSDVTDALYRPINTSTGEPGDGLKLAPAQMGMFDASYPIRRACRLVTAPGQRVVDARVDWSGPLTGSAASGVVGYDNARWVSLLETRDCYGRPRGPAGALLLHYNGHYAGSLWAYFGIDNVDLFDRPTGPMAEVLQQVATFMARGVFLRNLETGYRMYRAGESARLAVVVENRGREAVAPSVRFSLRDTRGVPCADRDVPPQRLTPASTGRFEAELAVPGDRGELLQAVATLVVDGRETDEIVSGVVLENREVVAAGPALCFRENYFTLNGRPMFLFGTDTYARLYNSASENPWTWTEELTRARDVGVNLYENLQYQRPGHVMQDDDWRAFQAVAQLTQSLQLVFMPGMLIGHNVAVGPDLLRAQSELCRQYARQLCHVPGLLYYINGDYQLRTDEHPEAVRRAWADWLRARYASMDALRAAWRSDTAAADFGEVEFPPPDTGHWDDVARIDYVRFLMELTTRWNNTHVTTIRHVDTRHPITSEYYARPSDGIDLPLTIGRQDVANIGYFDRPDVDIDRLPLSISFHDLRVRGQGVSLGEYGVKTHPAWSIENGATGYHIRRSEEQQKQLFMAVAHYGLGLGCSKIQNWCLRDGQAWVFPWGMFYPNQLVPKDVAWVHRNQSLLWRCFTPRYDPPALVVCQANHLRLGNNSVLGPEVFDRAVADLLAAHLPFGCVDDGHLEKLSAATKVLIYPAPFAVDDAAFGTLVSWVERGGTLLVTGDVSYDENRQATRAERLTCLAGVRLTDRRCPHVLRHVSGEVAAEFALGGGFRGTLRPCVRVEPAGGEVVGRDAGGEPVMVRHRLGRGTVFYLTDPLELGGEPRDAELRRRIYAAVAAACGVTPHDVSPDVPWLHVMVQPTAQGKVHVVFNTRPQTGSQTVRLATAAGQVDLTTRDRWPSLVAATASGDVVVINAFGTAAVDGQPLLDGAGQAAILSLDRQDLRRSQAVLVAPFEPGRIVLPARDGDYVAVVGEFVNGQWTAWESLTLPRERWDIELDEDRASALVLVCLREEQARWASQLTGMLCRPDCIEGF